MAGAPAPRVTAWPDIGSRFAVPRLSMDRRFKPGGDQLQDGFRGAQPILRARRYTYPSQCQYVAPNTSVST